MRDRTTAIPNGGTRQAGGGRNPLGAALGVEGRTAACGRTKSESDLLMERVVETSNMRSALKRVRQNQGAAGIDGLTTQELGAWLKQHWLRVKEALLGGQYMPRPVRKVEIPKPQGGVRTLGIPTVVDRLIQQALLQVLQPIFEPTFSPSSYGFRPGRNAGQAVTAAAQYVAEGRRWVVDIDLEKFFDRVNHDLLMARLARRITDRRILKLIRRFLEVGLMEDGPAAPRTEGTPQGGPLSPLLSNVLLTDLDLELTKRGLAFCRYADDCNIYVRSAAAGHRVMSGIRDFLENSLKLRINLTKSAVARPWHRKFLGYSMRSAGDPRLRIAPESVLRLKGRIRALLRIGRGHSLANTVTELNPLLRGWISYFRWAPGVRILEEVDQWIRRRLRCLIWRQWKRPKTRESRLLARGLTPHRAWKSSVNGRGPWWNAGAPHMIAAFPPAYFAQMGLVSLLATQRRLQRSS
jgi:RNA-directed DNA polymerase